MLEYVGFFFSNALDIHLTLQCERNGFLSYFCWHFLFCSHLWTDSISLFELYCHSVYVQNNARVFIEKKTLREQYIIAVHHKRSIRFIELLFHLIPEIKMTNSTEIRAIVCQSGMHSHWLNEHISSQSQNCIIQYASEATENTWSNESNRCGTNSKWIAHAREHNMPRTFWINEHHHKIK